MPLSGTFLADFASFDAAAQKAVISLTSMETGGAKVERSLNRTADSFSGKKIISDATLMARVFHDAGGEATFTTAELARMGAVGAEAMEKLRKSGQPIPAQLMAMGRATRQAGDAAHGSGGAAGKIDKLALSVGQADAMLGRFGVNLPPEVRGMADLASVGVTAEGALTAVGGAALVAGAGFAGWKLGEWIGGVTGLTQKIADGTAAALGWGDAIGQRAAAGADVLARASTSAKRPITDMGEAMAINAADAEKMIAGNTKASAAALQLAADTVKGAAMMAANREKIFKIEHDLAAAQKDFDDALKKKIADTAKGLAEDAANEEILANGTTSEIIKKQNHDVYLAKLADLIANKTDTKANRDQLLADEATANAHSLVNQQTLHTGRLKDAQDLAVVERNTYNEMIAHADQYTREALDAQLDKVRELEFAATAMGRAGVKAQDDQRDAAKRYQDELDKQKKQIQDAIDLNEKLIRSRSDTFDVTASSLGRAITETRFGGTGAYGEGASGAGYVPQATALATEGYSFTEILAILRGGQKYKPIGPRIPGFKRGVKNFGGGMAMVGEDGPELLNLPRGSGVTPGGGQYAEFDRLNAEQAKLYTATGGVVDAAQQAIVDRMSRVNARPGYGFDKPGGGDVSVQVHVSGVFDPASQAALTKAVRVGLGRAVLR